jgi:hypothetical protein
LALLPALEFRRWIRPPARRRAEPRRPFIARVHRVEGIGADS